MVIKAIIPEHSILRLAKPFTHNSLSPQNNLTKQVLL